MPARKQPKGAKGAPFSPMSAPREQEKPVRESKEVPIGRYGGEEEYRKAKEEAEGPLPPGGEGVQADPAVEGEE